MLIGLTGGIGSGKSTALAYFAEMGCQTLDADAICHELYEDASCEAYKEMIEHFGEVVVSGDGGIDRKKIADLVFKDKKEREWLNAMLHPMVLDRAVGFYTACDATLPVIFDVPLLFEVKWERYFTKIITVYTASQIQRERLLDRGMSPEEIDERIASQMPSELKIEKADFVLINNGSADGLKKQCRELHEKIFNIKGR